MQARHLRKRLVPAIAALLGLLGADHVRAETHALRAGSWLFGSPLAPDLEGPRNDLAAMESRVRGIGVTDVTTLRNAGVTRTTFESAVHDLNATGDSPLINARSSA